MKSNNNIVGGELEEAYYDDFAAHLKSFKLYQNNPNPFNHRTTISYIIPNIGYATLKVFDLLGQEIETLFEGIRQPGDYEATFDGEYLRSGIYFYRLKGGDYMNT